MADNQLPVAAPVTTDSGGANAATALNAVVRVVCPKTGSVGTGFLHSSGWIITAEHVVRGSPAPQTLIVTSGGAQIEAAEIRADRNLDLAIVRPKALLKCDPLALCPSSNFAV